MTLLLIARFVPKIAQAKGRSIAVTSAVQTASVSRLFDKTQALNGDDDGPVLRQSFFTSAIMALLPATTPPSTRPCPSIHLVAECEMGSTETGGLLQVGRCEAIIYVENQRVMFAELSGEGEVYHVEAGVRGRFQKKHFGVRLSQCLPLRRVTWQPIEADAPFGKVLRDDGIA